MVQLIGEADTQQAESCKWYDMRETTSGKKEFLYTEEEESHERSDEWMQETKRGKRFDPNDSGENMQKHAAQIMDTMYKRPAGNLEPVEGDKTKGTKNILKRPSSAITAIKEEPFKKPACKQEPASPDNEPNPDEELAIQLANTDKAMRQANSILAQKCIA